MYIVCLAVIGLAGTLIMAENLNSVHAVTKNMIAKELLNYKDVTAIISDFKARNDYQCK